MSKPVGRPKMTTLDERLAVIKPVLLQAQDAELSFEHARQLLDALKGLTDPDLQRMDASMLKSIGHAIDHASARLNPWDVAYQLERVANRLHDRPVNMPSIEANMQSLYNTVKETSPDAPELTEETLFQLYTWQAELGALQSGLINGTFSDEDSLTNYRNTLEPALIEAIGTVKDRLFASATPAARQRPITPQQNTNTSQPSQVSREPKPGVRPDMKKTR